MDSETIQDVFSGLGPVRTRKMFGGQGVYRHDLMFALEAYGELYLKVDKASVEAFRAAGSRPFVSEGGPTHADELLAHAGRRSRRSGEAVRWGRLALEAACEARSLRPEAGLVPARKPRPLLAILGDGGPHEEGRDMIAEADDRRIRFGRSRGPVALRALCGPVALRALFGARFRRLGPRMLQALIEALPDGEGAASPLPLPRLPSATRRTRRGRPGVPSGFLRWWRPVPLHGLTHQLLDAPRAPSGRSTPPA